MIRQSSLFFALLLLVSGLFSRLIFISYPPQVVWDETHFVTFAASYLSGKPFTDIHPPLGKLLIAATLKSAGAKPIDDNFTANTPYPAGFPYAAGRFVAGVAGGLLPLVVFLTALSLGLSPLVSLAVGFFTLFDNALLAESRYMLIDILVPFFAIAGAGFFIAHLGVPPSTRKWWAYIASASFFAGCAMSTKWTGAGLLGATAIFAWIEYTRDRDFRLFLKRGAILIGVPMVIYGVIFGMHYMLLKETGDTYLSQAHSTAFANMFLPVKENVAHAWDSFIEFHRASFTTNMSLSGTTHSASSPWYMWPLGGKSIGLYEDDGRPQSRLSIAGNPAVWGLGALGIFGGVILLLVYRKKCALLSRDPYKKQSLQFAEFLFLFYIFNWIPFVFITRPMFMYHYFTALIVSLLFGALVACTILPTLVSAHDIEIFSLHFDLAALSRYSAWFAVILVVIFFLMLSPLTYGIPIL